MGSSVLGYCNCGYETGEILIGGGMRNHETYCGFPHYCLDCKHLFTGNIFDQSVSCPKCKSKNVVSYDDRRACQYMEYSIVDWNVKRRLGRELLLSAENNICPKCGEYALFFRTGMTNWD